MLWEVPGGLWFQKVRCGSDCCPRIIAPWAGQEGQRGHTHPAAPPSSLSDGREGTYCVDRAPPVAFLACAVHSSLSFSQQGT